MIIGHFRRRIGIARKRPPHMGRWLENDLELIKKLVLQSCSELQDWKDP